ncbi:MAG: aspartate 1-decarboxylase [Thermoguttaceae bacterium]|nr:aspartate 1-decarboxylase [Thermoguttaceae bacterium]MDW8079222.1 aspartate 1-decarboxylase [Thermoguttaceae bacterium]
MLKSKIHHARVTGTELEYEGSITIDRRLMEAARLLPGEQVHVLNLNTGDRFITYVIEGPPDSGTIVLNGPAARLGAVGDRLIVLSYCVVPEDQAAQCQPVVVRVDEKNRIVP